MTELIFKILQVAVALSLLNVWLVRFQKATPYRGGMASSLREEFSVYGLPSWLVYVVGTLKVGAAIALLVGIFMPEIVVPASALVIVLMTAAIAMHIKIKDSMLKSLPAFLLLVSALGIAFVGKA